MRRIIFEELNIWLINLVRIIVLIAIPSVTILLGVFISVKFFDTTTLQSIGGILSFFVGIFLCNVACRYDIERGIWW